MSDQQPLAGFHSSLLDGAAEALRGYFGLADGSAFTGARFSTYGRVDPWKITGDDLAATCLLSIGVSAPRAGLSGWAPAHFLAIEDRQDEIAGLLRQLPVDTDLHTLSESAAQSLVAWDDTQTPGRRLYELLRRGLGDIGPGRVAVYKLLARKRPRLFPIRDGVVERAVGHANPDPWWMPWWHSMANNPDAVVALEAARAVVPQPLRPSVLRTADIVIWMNFRD